MRLDEDAQPSRGDADYVTGEGVADDGKEAALWRRYRESDDESARQALLDLHLPYAKVVAASYFSRRMHDEIEFGEYLQLASVGLLEAMERFELGRRAGFRTYAARRMHGSILNGLEKLTEKQRQISARQRLEAERINELKAAAPEGSPSLGESEKVLRYVAEVGLGFALAWLLDGTGMVNDSKGAETIPFYHHVEMRELRQRVRDLVEELPEQERLVVFSHYLQQQPFDEICVSMSLSKGRISQIHRRALTRLRDSLRGHSPLDVHW